MLFPLLRLPLSAALNVWKFTPDGETIVLAVISTRIRKLVIPILKKKNLTLSIIPSETSCSELTLSLDNEEIAVFYIGTSLNHTHTPFHQHIVRSGCSRVVMFQNQVEGLRIMCSFFANFVKSYSIRYCFAIGNYYSMTKTIVRALDGRAQFEKFCSSEADITQDYLKLLVNCENIELEFQLSATPLQIKEFIEKWTEAPFKSFVAGSRTSDFNEMVDVFEGARPIRTPRKLRTITSGQCYGVSKEHGVKAVVYFSKNRLFVRDLNFV